MQQFGAETGAENMILSPYSVASSLLLLLQATNGNTFEQLQKGLNLNSNKTEIANQFHAYNDLVRNSAGDAGEPNI